VRGDIRRSDKKQLGATLTEQIARSLIELNRGPQNAYPRIKLMEPESHDPEKVVKIAAEAARLGLRISKEDVLNKTGLKAADDDEDAIEPPAPAPDPADRENPPARPPAPPPRQARAAAICPVHGAAHAANQAERETDRIDELVAGMIAESHEAVAPMLEPILALAAECQSFDEFRDRLPALAGKMQTGALRHLVTRGGFAARLAGIADEVAAAEAAASGDA
jgi:phage gp29-like protein